MSSKNGAATKEPDLLDQEFRRTTLKAIAVKDLPALKAMEEEIGAAREKLEAKLLGNPSPDNRIFTIQSLLQALTNPRSPIEVVAAYLLHRPSITIIAGPKGSGKSTLSQQFGIDLSDGRPVLGEFPVTRPYRVLYLTLEHPPALTQQSLQELISGSGVEIPETFFIRYRDEHPRLDLFGDPSCTDLLEKCIKEKQIEVLIIDTFSRSHTGNELKNDEMIRVMAILEDLRDRYGLLIIVVHHNRKSGQNGDDAEGFDRVRGGGSIVAAAETVISLEGGGDDRKLTLRSNIPGVVPHVGLSYSRDAAAGKIVLRSVAFRSLQQRIIEAVERGADTRLSIAAAAGLDERDGGFRRALQRLVGGILQEDRSRRPYSYSLLRPKEPKS